MAVVMLVANGMHLVVLYDKTQNRKKKTTRIATHTSTGQASVLTSASGLLHCCNAGAQ